MTREPYSVEDAGRDLGTVLDRAPSSAVAGEWIATTVQAGHATRSGGYTDAEGRLVDEASGRAFDAVDQVVDRLEVAGASRFNTVVIRWTRARFPWQRGRVAVETRFDPAIVPRAPDDPVYGLAAAARRGFWARLGDVEPGFAAERGVPNSFGQTKWYGPHRRVLLVRRPEGFLLATDGLSPPGPASQTGRTVSAASSSFGSPKRKVLSIPRPSTSASGPTS